MAVRTVLGRHRSDRTPAEELAIFREELENLDPDERETLRLMFEETRAARSVEQVRTYKLQDGTEIVDKGQLLYSLIAEVEYAKQPIGIEEWLGDSYHMGKIGFSWQRWREDIRTLFTQGYHEAIFTGAIGIGKSTMVEVCLARLIYEFSCLRNPQQTYGLMPGGKIYVAVMNVNEDLARKVVFEGLLNKLEQSEYFEREYQFEATQKIIRFPNGLRIIPRSSTDTSVLGLDVIGGVLSEVNFNDSVESRRAALAQRASQSRHGIETDIGKVYSELVTRWKSRFGRASGKLPGLFIIDSSKRDQTDFTETHLVDVKDDPFVFVRDYAMWDVQPADRFSKKRFRIFVGDEKVTSRILGPEDEIEPEKGTTQQIVEVPENWRRQAEEDLDAFLRNVAGIATVSIDRFFSSMNGVQAAMTEWKKSFVSPFPSDVMVTDQKLAIDWNKQGKVVDGAWRLDQHPKADHAVHFDMAYRRDRFGQAAGYIAGEKMVERTVAGETVLERAPIIVVRWCVGLQAPRDSEIELSHGRSILWSAMQHGMRVRWGSCDQWNSVETLQKMTSRGIDAEQVSVDGEQAYLIFRSAANEGRLLLPNSPLLYDELKHLLWDKARGKVDHPPKKSKDVADAVCGVIFRLTTLFLEDQAHPVSPSPILGLSYVEDSEEEDQDLWVLETKGRPLEVEEVQANRSSPGVGPGGHNPPPPQRKKHRWKLK